MPETVYPVLLKDESGRAISPIVRTSTIYNGAGNPIGDFVSESELSDQFDTTKAYAKGDYCIKDNTVYKFTAAKSAGAWDSTKVLETKIADEVSLINSNLAELQFEYGTAVSVDVINDTSYTPTSNGFLVGRVRKASGSSYGAFGMTSSALNGGYKFLGSSDISEGYIPMGSIFLIAGETVTFAKSGLQANGTEVKFLPIKVKVS